MSELINLHAGPARQKLVIGCDDMIVALNELLISKKHIAEQIHSLRKLGKSLRGGSVILDGTKTAAREIQAVGRLLAERRDATSRRKTWEKLHWKPRHPSARAISDLLKQQVSAANRKPPKTAILWAISRVQTAKQHLQELPEEELSERLAKGIAKLEKQLVKRSRRIDRHGEDDFHELRKSIKALLGAHKFLPEISHPQAASLDELADILGDENDLTTLGLWLEQHGFTSRLEPDLWKKIDKSRNKLRAEAVHKASELDISSN